MILFILSGDPVVVFKSVHELSIYCPYKINGIRNHSFKFFIALAPILHTPHPFYSGDHRRDSHVHFLSGDPDVRPFHLVTTISSGDSLVQYPEISRIIHPGNLSRPGSDPGPAGGGSGVHKRYVAKRVEWEFRIFTRNLDGRKPKN